MAFWTGLFIIIGLFFSFYAFTTLDW